MGEQQLLASASLCMQPVTHPSISNTFMEAIDTGRPGLRKHNSENICVKLTQVYGHPEKNRSVTAPHTMQSHEQLKYTLVPLGVDAA